MRATVLAGALLTIVACGGAVETTPDAGSVPDAGGTRDAGHTCEPPTLCFAGCSVSSPGCLKGRLDVDTCACLDDSGLPLAWPDPNAALVALQLSPSPAADALVGDELTFGVVARFEDGVDRSATREATLTFEPNDAFEVLGPGRMRAVRPGDVRIEFEWGGQTIVTNVRVRRAEARGVWVTRFEWTDAESIRALVNGAADAGFNVVFFQVRGTGDAYYASTREPWAAKLGALGRDPGWDPLQVAIDAAHARGIELHAYVNAFTAWGSGSPPASPAGAPTHPLRAHPEWLERDSGGATIGDGYQWFAPGIEAVRVHNTEVVREILQNYDVDGIHLDRIRYSGRDMGWNEQSRAAFAAAGGGDDAAFTRFRVEAVNDQVRRIEDVIRATKPTARLTAAVWGIHTKLPGCSTSQGLADFHQDSWAWASGGYIDALVPMIYWADGTGCTDYSDLLGTFLEHRGPRAIWGGMHVLDKDASCSGNCAFKPDLLTTRIGLARNTAAQGVVLYSASMLAAENRWSVVGTGSFADEAAVPPLVRE